MTRPAKCKVLVCLVLTCILFQSFYLISKDEDVYTFVYPSYFGSTIQKKDTLKKSVVQLGRFLFYDKRLSGNNTVSCASCHQQKFAFTDPKALSEGVNGATTRNSISLTNLMWHGMYFWDGRSKTLEEQALIPIQNKIEMDQDLDSLLVELNRIPLYKKLFAKAYVDKKITKEHIATAIAQFEKTIVSSGSRFDQFLSGDKEVLTEEEKKGYVLFTTIPDARTGKRGAGCSLCHSSNLLHEQNIRNNGLDSTFKDQGVGDISKNHDDIGKFKVPSLRNIAVTAPYMHDGRFQTLEAVLNHYSHGIKMSPSVSSFLPYMSNMEEGKSLQLDPTEIKSIIAFLNSLTDKSLLNKKEYSNPFD
ncbi:MAG: Cytochrome-c peroxidase [Chitinophagaceae bacterium]|nr:Cytochrome-c peroxidase [Chitinophagaceae bacterium]